MSTSQSRTVLLGCLLAVLVAAFPAWRYVGWGLNGETPVTLHRPAGRAFLLSEPQPLVDAEFAGRLWPTIDAGRLVAELAVILATTGSVVSLVSSLASFDKPKK